MYHVWVEFGNDTDEGIKDLKASFLTPNAYGVVLDVGAGKPSFAVETLQSGMLIFLIAIGHGHAAQYLNLDKVTKYVALEPNTKMHNEIRAAAKEAGFTEEAGTLLIIPYGAEQTNLINSALDGPQYVDTMISILALCGIPKPEETIRVLTDEVLKPGGQVLFYEHVLSRRSDVAWWQRFWTPLWKHAFDGCCLDRPTDIWLENLDIWDSKDLWGKEGEPEEHLWWHRGGKLVKAM